VSDTLIMWLFGGAFGCILGLGGLWLSHIRDCREVRAMLAELNTNMTTVLREIGTHETGLRGSLHKLRSEISPFVLWVQGEKERRK
jgi:hypothetical protein